MLLTGREREKGRIGKIPGPSLSKSGKSRKKSGKPQKGRKRAKKEGQVQIGKPPRLKPPPRLAALESWGGFCFEKFGRIANGYFVNGYFEFQFAKERGTFLGELEGCLFLSEGSCLFPPFLSLSGGLLETFHIFSKYPFARYPCASLWKFIFLKNRAWKPLVGSSDSGKNSNRGRTVGGGQEPWENRGRTVGGSKETVGEPWGLHREPLENHGGCTENRWRAVGEPWRFGAYCLTTTQ